MKLTILFFVWVGITSNDPVTVEDIEARYGDRCREVNPQAEITAWWKPRRYEYEWNGVITRKTYGGYDVICHIIEE